jgi:hypothetical protein
MWLLLIFLEYSLWPFSGAYHLALGILPLNSHLLASLKTFFMFSFDGVFRDRKYVASSVTVSFD